MVVYSVGTWLPIYDWKEAYEIMVNSCLGSMSICDHITATWGLN